MVSVLKSKYGISFTKFRVYGSHNEWSRQLEFLGIRDDIIRDDIKGPAASWRSYSITVFRVPSKWYSPGLTSLRAAHILRN